MLRRDPHPYADAAEEWRDAGWSPVPLPPRAKKYPPPGFTGAEGREADAQQVAAWIAERPDSNLALRMPRGVCGLDVDAYKPVGMESWKELQTTCGPLPVTWTLTSRSDGESGIRLFRIPTDVRLQGNPRPGIEIIQFHHRYAIAWPSWHPETGDQYQLYGPDGDDNCPLPRPDELPALPAQWLEHLREQERPAGVAAPKRHVGDWSNAVTQVFANGVAGMTKGSRHDTVRDTVAALCRLEVQNHPGATDAIDRIGNLFRDAIVDRAKPAEAEKEWNDLLTGGRALVASTKSDRASWDELTSSGPEITTLTDGEPQPDVQGLAAKLLTPVLPDEFWDTRPLFAHIRQAAHARTRSPDLVLHATLARLAAYTKHAYTIPPLTGTRGSLNYFVAGIGPSGSGKTSSVSLSAELIRPPDALNVADNMPLGSGEGVAELYMGTKDTKDEDGKKTKERTQVRHNALILGDEGAALTAIAERSGATLGAQLRTAWTGGDLGQANASADRTRVIHAGRYRLAVIVCFQPELAGKLLADADAGTPQRFIWASALDPHAPTDKPEWPGPLDLPTIPATAHNATKKTVRGEVVHDLAVDPAIVTELQQRATAVTRGELKLDQLDEHGPLHRLKIAGLLAIADGRLDINLEDWALSDTIWETSKAVRATVQQAVARHQAHERAARIDFRAESELAAEAARRSVPVQAQRIAARLARWLHEQPERTDGYPLRDLISRLASKERHLLDEAVAVAINKGWMVDSDGRFKPGESQPS